MGNIDRKINGQKYLPLSGVKLVLTSERKLLFKNNHLFC